MTSAGFRTNETVCLLSYEAPYLGHEGGRPGMPTQTVRHTCSGNLEIVEILRKKQLAGRSPPGQRGPVIKQT